MMHFSGDWMRGIMQRLDEATVPGGPLIATEYTADGPVSWFKVENKETLDMLTQIEQHAFDEADYWGGFKAFSSVEEANEGVDGEAMVPVQELQNKPVLTQNTVKQVYDKLSWEDPAMDDEDYEDEIQRAYQDLLDPYQAHSG